jgi:thiosulfate dehydrogenase [quinone] large subunit
MQNESLTGSRLYMLVILRVLIGWHFLYEGVVKIMGSGWSSASYLLDSKGWFSPIYIYLAQSSSTLKIIDFLNMWGLAAIGLGLILGCFTRIATISGIILLCIYYLSHPPFIGLSFMLPNEGSYLFVNKTLIEIFSMIVLLLFPTHKIIGLDRWLYFICKKCRKNNN